MESFDDFSLEAQIVVVGNCASLFNQNIMEELGLEHTKGDINCAACDESSYDEQDECECGGILHVENQVIEINYGGYYPMETERIEEHSGIVRECDKCGKAYFRHRDCEEEELVLSKGKST